MAGLGVVRDGGTPAEPDELVARLEGGRLFGSDSVLLPAERRSRR